MAKNAKRGFCNKCGASIFFKFKPADDISIAAGLFNGKTGLKTMRNIFVGTKSDFYKIKISFLSLKDLLISLIL